MSKKITIGSRGSKLALLYAQKARDKIIKNTDFTEQDIAIEKITTKGDEFKDVRLSEFGGKGLFSSNIEKELKHKNIDIAVHALKDMPAFETHGLLTGCFLERNDPREILISKNNKKFLELKAGSVIGTSSLRREFQLKKIRKDLNYKLIRGNVDTRIKKLNENLYDAIILSYAGVQSLNLNKKISQIFSTSEIIPSAGQGVIAVQCRQDDHNIINLLKNIDHKLTHICIEAERNILKILEGDCETAVGAFAKIYQDEIVVEAELFSLDGKERFYLKSSNNIKFASNLGKEVGEMLKKQSKNSYKK